MNCWQMWDICVPICACMMRRKVFSRNFVDTNRNKSFIENSFWKKIPKGGVLKVTDENSLLFGKYIGCNFTGVAIQRCLQED